LFKRNRTACTATRRVPWALNTKRIWGTTALPRSLAEFNWTALQKREEAERARKNGRQGKERKRKEGRKSR